MNWYYNGKEITNVNDPIVPQRAIGFIYKISRYLNKSMANDAYRTSPFTLNLNLPDKRYIGKKLLTSATKKKVGKRASAKQLLETGDKRKVKKIIRGSKVSNWMVYHSSCKPLQEEIKEHPELFRKEIIEFVFSKRDLTYKEVWWMFHFNVLEIDSYNDNILGKFFKLKVDDRTREEGITG